MDAPGWQDLKTLLPRRSGIRRRAAVVLSELLSAGGLTLNVESRGQPILQIGQGIRASFLARLLRIGPVRIRLAAVALFFRR